MSSNIQKKNFLAKIISCSNHYTIKLFNRINSNVAYETGTEFIQT